jgi:hypothetical protein
MELQICCEQEYKVNISFSGAYKVIRCFLSTPYLNGTDSSGNLNPPLSVYLFPVSSLKKKRYAQIFF